MGKANKRKYAGASTPKNKRLKTDENSPFFDFSSPRAAFESLIAPSPYSEFVNDIWERKPLVNARNNSLSDEKSGALTKIFSTELLENVTECMRLEFGRDLHVCQFDGKRTVDVIEKGHLTSAKIKKLLSEKCTFQIHQPQRYSDLLWRLLENLESFFGCLVGCNVYITPPGSQGLAPHYDDVEVFILQLQGSKHWRLYKPQVELARDYVANLNPDQLGEPVEDLVLKPGDFLYFPRGTVHQAQANEGEDCSTHITISTYQHQSYGDYLRSGIFQSVEEMIRSSVDFRKGLPIGSLIRPEFRFGSKESAKNLEMVSHLKVVIEQLSSSIQKCPTPDAMLMDFWSSRLPPFGVTGERLKDGQPDSPLPTLSDRVRLLHKNHVCMFERIVEDEMEDDESDGEDGPAMRSNSSSTTALCVCSSLMNSRGQHMVMNGEDDDEKESPEPAISIRFPLSFKESMKRLMDEDFVDVKALELEDEDKLKLLSSLWSCHLLEAVDS